MNVTHSPNEIIGWLAGWLAVSITTLPAGAAHGVHHGHVCRVAPSGLECKPRLADLYLELVCCELTRAHAYRNSLLCLSIYLFIHILCCIGMYRTDCTTVSLSTSLSRVVCTTLLLLPSLAMKGIITTTTSS